MPTAQATTSQQTPMKASPTAPPTNDKSRGGPKKGSSNARRHGLRMGALMPGVPHIGKDLNEVRRWLEGCVQAQHGVLSPQDELTINRIMRFERKLRLSERYTAMKGDDMVPETWLAFERESGRWLLQRDRAAADLGLSDKQYASLYAAFNGTGND